ncbi:MAG TPA: D-alanyl-D-alanine carboxypeptidase/D-alanyl-D-alanine-endopeptidase [Caulifigura sp.]|nr:D-alanyl-D-alanine carboxypeptidase/D-alanyl-D-alanine-endopeptidase [Caulifigura sp.]
MLRAILLACVCLPCSHLFAADEPAWKKDVAEVQARPEYRHAHWGLLVTDLKTGEVLHQENSDKLFAPASVTKLFSVSAAWSELGPDHKFHTPLYRRGDIAEGGRLEGDLILQSVADLTLGGRTTAAGRIAFKNGDHTYANGNSTAQLTEEDPLAGVASLAQQVKAAGIRRITGDILIDDRLFEIAGSTGSGPGRVSPVLLNDNVLDVLITPGEAGRPATVTTRPEMSLVRVDALVDTVAADGKISLRQFWGGPGRVVVRGTIPAGRAPVLKVVDWQDSEFMLRGALIDALRAAGVTVDASQFIPQRPGSLPPLEWYASAPRVASLESLPFSENARLILKVSHNLHASTLPLLLASRHGKRNLAEGLQIEGDLLARLGVDRDTISFGGGAGGDRADYVTPRATLQLLRSMSVRPDFPRFKDCLPILGGDGTLGTIGVDSPAKGKVFAKTGTLYWDNLLNDRTLLTAKGLAGYIDAQSGRPLAFAFFVNMTHLPNSEATAREGKTLGRLAEIFQQAF